MTPYPRSMQDYDRPRALVQTPAKGRHLNREGVVMAASVGRKEASFSSYPAYKPVDLLWLEAIPTEWSLPKLRFVARVNPPKSGLSIPLEAADPVSFIPMEAVGEGGGLELCHERPVSSVEDRYTYFENGDVLVAKITPCFENGKGALAANLVSGVGFGTTELHVLRPGPRLDDRFLFYLTQSDHFRRLGEHAMYGAGGQKRISTEFVEQFKHPIPPPDIQPSIANFLDRKTSRIDKLIARKKRLIELLEEKRTALITRAVTKGLDPDVPMKDSGVEWLGEIPEHWEVVQLHHICHPGRPIMYGIVLPGPDAEDGVPIVKGGDVAARRLAPRQLAHTTSEIANKNKRSSLRTGDVLYSIRGSYGDVAIVPPELEGSNITQDTARVSPRRLEDSIWLSFALRSDPIFAQLDAGALGATISGINIRDLKRVKIPLPPASERELIGARLTSQITMLKRTIEKIQQGIALMGEYRTALISAAVTGKIDVPDRAA